MRNKFIAVLLVSVGVLVHMLVFPTGIDLKWSWTATETAMMIGFLLPGLLFATIVGFVVSLVVWLFSKDRSRQKFYLIFSIFFLLTILAMAYGSTSIRLRKGGVVYEGNGKDAYEGNWDNWKQLQF